jgi:hypothetical protein
MAFTPFDWTCPYCNRAQTVAEAKYGHWTNSLGVYGGSHGTLALQQTSIGCASPDCGKTTVHVIVAPSNYRHDIGQWTFIDAPLVDQRVMPGGTGKPQPDYIPPAIREDYAEACLIRELSPKASATLIRRCLQGMIRDFAGISKNRLIDEIDALRTAVEEGTADRSITPETVEAIDHIRGVGNIGAHMEKDIDHIIPVDPGEAQALIDLVEMLFEEWYVAREVRKKRLGKIADMADHKKALKNGGAADVASA